MTNLEKFIVARWAYGVSQPIMGDAEYSLLYKVIEQEYPDSEYLKRTWSDDPCPTELLFSIGREDLVRKITLTDKTESIPSLESVVEIEAAYGGLNETVSVSMKEDGWNTQLNVYNGKAVSLHTRGRNTDDFKYLNNLLYKFPETYPFKDKAKIVMEATVNDDVFKYAKQKYGVVSQRGAVSTLIANKQDSHLLDFHATDIISDTLAIPPAEELFYYLESLGFKTVPFYIANDFDSLMNACHQLDKDRQTYPTPTDGIVVRGLQTKALRFLSWTPPILRSYVEGYYTDYGTQSISIGVSIRPIQLQNSVQRQVACTNLKRVINCNLQIGAPVAFKFVSEAIGVLDEEATKLLQEVNKDWDSYKAMIDYNELLKERIGD